MPTDIAFVDARRAGLQGLVDYAGLFPPASLDMTAAVAGYRAARASGEAWMVDRFICPASRLEELAGELAKTMAGGEASWRLSLLGDAAGDDWVAARLADVAAGHRFQREMEPAAVVDLLETPLPGEVDEAFGGQVAVVARAAADRLGAPSFFEVPPGAALDTALDALAVATDLTGRVVGAKLRCGGANAAAIPSPERVAAFVVGCRRRGLRFKATAGLHKPFRHRDEATGWVRHGFVNLLVAAAMAGADHDESTVAAAVADGADVFRFTRRALVWRDLEIDAGTLEAARRDGFVSYGSCDFAEPVAELAGAGVLPVSP